MDFMEVGKIVVLGCESELRGLAASAAKNGDYEAVRKIMPIAQQIGRIAGQCCQDHPGIPEGFNAESRPREVLEAIRAGKTQKAIAEEFGVCRMTVTNIVRASRLQGILP